MPELKGYGHKPTGYHPETHLHKKAPKRVRKNQGMTQGTAGRTPRKMTEPGSPGARYSHGLALVKALEGMSNKKHSHDGSK